MTSVIVTIDDIREEYGQDLTPLQETRMQRDLDAVTQSIENWLRVKLVDTTITDERHEGISEYEEIRFNWMPVKNMTGIRWDLLTGTLLTDYNEWWHAPLICRGQVYYVSYVTDASRIADYIKVIERIIINAVMPSLYQSDVIRYRVISSYNVEGLSISYVTSGGEDTRKAGPIPGTDLSQLSSLRRTVIR